MVLSQKIFALGKELVGTDGEVKGYSRVMKFIHLWCLKFCHKCSICTILLSTVPTGCLFNSPPWNFKFTGAISSVCQKCAWRYHIFTTTCTPGLESLLHLFLKKYTFPLYIITKSLRNT